MLRELSKVLRYPRLQAFYGLIGDVVFRYVSFLRRVPEIVELNPLMTAPIRDVNDIIVITWSTI